MPLPAFLSSNDAVAPAVDRVTSSPETLPERAAVPVESRLVADTVRSYTRLLAVMLITLSVLGEIRAVPTGWVTV